MTTAMEKAEGTEGNGLEFGECKCEALDAIFEEHMFEGMMFTQVAKHSHLCSCGWKWWHSRMNVSEDHDDHAHECPKCGKTVTMVHGWDDPNDKVKSHHIHHDHLVSLTQ